jgi:hypothetical protein
MNNYNEFLIKKSQFTGDGGFGPLFMPSFLFDFQQSIVEWATRRGRAAIFADCGLGKTPMQLVWAENVVRKTNKRVLIATPLAVGHQTIREGDKFGIECRRSMDGRPAGNITVTNYERLHLFNPDDYIGVVCDESSILKNFDGKRKAIITDFMRTRPYRLLCTATAAPNDYIELGTTSEALGELGYMDMLNRFFKNDNSTSDIKRSSHHGGDAPKWRFKKHAEIPFWRWVCSWARALRRPSDIGFDDGHFVLPPLIERETVIKNDTTLNGELFIRPAVGLCEQRQERRLTVKKRCEEAAAKINGGSTAVAWCHLNDEGDLLAELIPDAVQVSGADSDEKKEEAFIGFADKKIRVLITKPKIGGFGMNWQHCQHITFFPSHSFEQYYQGVRRCWRFGQKKPVTVDIISSEGEVDVLKNLQRKAKAADLMFSHLVRFMNDAACINRDMDYNKPEEVPSWL